MESLNMSKLNLSSVRSQPVVNNVQKTEDSETKSDKNVLIDWEDDYHCEYREDIWKHLLVRESEKPIIHLQSPQLEFRGALVQQLRDVTKKLGLTIATLHSAVALLDLFMDAHRLRSDRLTHVALACLSLAAKSEEKFSRAPTLKTLSKLSRVQLCGKTFRQLEWMVGQHVRWRLLAPTPVTFASLLAQYVITDSDLTTRHPKFVRRFKRDGAKLLEAYLDLTLSDVRLKVVESVDVGCACVACARADLGLFAWPLWLANIAGRKTTTVAPIARLLQRMMQILKARETPADSEVDQGYGSARTSPNPTPNSSPQFQASPASSSCSSTSQSCLNIDNSYRQRPLNERRIEVNDQKLNVNGQRLNVNDQRLHVNDQRLNVNDQRFNVNDQRLHVNDQRLNVNDQRFNVSGQRLDVNQRGPDGTYSVLDFEPNIDYYRLPTAVDMTCQRVDNPSEYRYCMSRRLLEASIDSVQPTTSKAVKRGLETAVDLEKKRYRLTSQMSQIVL